MLIADYLKKEKQKSKVILALFNGALVVLFYLSTSSTDIGIHPTQVDALIT